MPATTITNALLNRLRSHMAGLPAYAQYKVGNTWNRAEIQKSEVRENESIYISFICVPVDAGLTPATSFRVCAGNNDVLLERSETLAFASSADILTYRFKIGINAGEEITT